MSKSTKTFKYVGVSLFNNNVKARYTNDFESRKNVMEKGGHKNIQFMELPRAMTKAEIESEGFREKALASYNDGTVTKSVKVHKPAKTKSQETETVV